MDIEIQKIENLYRKFFSNYIDSLKNLSFDTANNIPLVQSMAQAYNFDKIKIDLYQKHQPTSADALYFNNKIAFIEFKAGFKPKGKNNSKYKKNCKNSANDSIKIHNEFLKNNPINVNYSMIKTIFIVVINSSKNGKPSSAYAQTLASSAKLEANLKIELEKKFSEKYIANKDTVYSEVDVWNDVNFDTKLSKI